jgi:hypothetical protein
MTVYEMRTYTLHVGKMAEAVKLYTELGYPALQKGGQNKKLIGYFQADTGMINQLVHLWKFTDDADRRAHCRSIWQQGLRRGLRGEVPSAGRVPGGQAADRGAVGPASLTRARQGTAMAHWLLKSEPDDWSWAEQVAKGRHGAEWTGISFSAQKHLRAMKKGEQAFSTTPAKRAIVGIVRVIASAPGFDRHRLVRHRRRRGRAAPDAGRPRPDQGGQALRRHGPGQAAAAVGPAGDRCRVAARL